ncbi:hypothetical protein D9619_005161 [Psilocybe cf. subviscida]|uniref:Uncharacterized protein n=1 Tax=Psilocybe cf. subviscida TaxID=2480587 RepID=A0A8H5BRC8_9AGAR|nr:hypothetical protein D9619_005161 [Psilocybe cf. subviscida]
MLQPLALELYRTVVENVDDTTDLLALALCCSALRDEAQRCLFRKVAKKSLAQQAQFISTINASPSRFGPWVHDFYVVLYYEENLSPISSALHAMRNLKHLQICLAGISKILPGCTFKLRSLTCLYDNDLEYLLCHFLPTQQSIKRIRFPALGPPVGALDTAGMPMNLCPKLDFLDATDARFVRAILRDSRLIKRFQWRSFGPLPSMTIKQLNHLEYLYLTTEEWQIDSNFTRHLLSLVLLELYDKQNDGRNVQTNFQFLQNIPRLRVLIVSVGIFFARNWRSVDFRRNELLSAPECAFGVHPTLELMSGTSWSGGYDCSNMPGPVLGRDRGHGEGDDELNGVDGKGLRFTPEDVVFEVWGIRKSRLEMGWRKMDCS